ncbi:MAG: hypothetical protein NTW04_05420 [Elusimicrobia bacterium]|nr:hypothetical protein [Elusimicrobiota bacterium]
MPATPLYFKYSPLILSALTAVVAFAKNKKLAFCAIFYAITISPMAQAIPLGWAITADRYAYLPSLGIFIAIGFLFAGAYQKSKIAAMAVALVICAGLSFSTVKMCRVWQNSVSLWERATEIYPSSFIAQSNLSQAYNQVGKFNEALISSEKAISLNKKPCLEYLNRGMAYLGLGKKEAAKKDFQSTALCTPDAELKSSIKRDFLGF